MSHIRDPRNLSTNKDIKIVDDEDMNTYVRRNMLDYHKKGLLDIIDRENHHAACSACATSRPKNSSKPLVCTHKTS